MNETKAAHIMVGIAVETEEFINVRTTKATTGIRRAETATRRTPPAVMLKEDSTDGPAPECPACRMQLSAKCRRIGIFIVPIPQYGGDFGRILVGI